MALYSLGLIEKASNAIFHRYPSNDTMQEAFYYQENVMGHDVDFASNNTSIYRASGVSIGKENTLIRSQKARAFDPSFDSTLDDKYDEKFTVEGSTMYLNLSGCFSVGELQTLYSHANHVQSALYLSILTSGTYAYNLIKLNVALRHEEDADLPEFWAMSKHPDLTFVFDHNEAYKNRIVSDMKLDVTQMLCESPRYRESGTQWRSHFTPSTYTFVGA